MKKYYIRAVEAAQITYTQEVEANDEVEALNKALQLPIESWCKATDHNNYFDFEISEIKPIRPKETGRRLFEKCVFEQRNEEKKHES